MNRTQIYLEEEQIRQLDELAKRQGKRRSSLVRQAVSAFLIDAANNQDWKTVYRRSAGLWKNRDNIESEMVDIRRSLDRD